MNIQDFILENFKKTEVLIIDQITNSNFETRSPDNIIQNHRLSSLHKKFKCVAINYPEVSSKSYWQIFYDECLRFLKKDSYLIIKTQVGSFSSPWGIKSFLSDKLNFNLNLTKQFNDEDGFTISIFKVKRFFNNSKNWTIGIPSNGQRNENIYKFLISVESAQRYLKLNKDLNIKIQYLIAGPKLNNLKNFNVKFLNTKINDNLPRLGEKKKLIVENAKYENILIIHDRYILNENFFIGFEDWGYDYDFCAINKYDFNNNIFDPILFLESMERANKQMYRIKNQNYIFNNLYINGALMIGKKNILQSVNFSESLLQGESEDIDLSIRLQSRGVVPRFNPLSSAVTITDVFKSNLGQLPWVNSDDYYQS